MACRSNHRADRGIPHRSHGADNFFKSSGFMLMRPSEIKSPAKRPREVRMTPDERERMQVLCEQIAKEENRERFTNLVHELNELLENKVQRLDHPASPPK
jgi:hypothetical protein